MTDQKQTYNGNNLMKHRIRPHNEVLHEDHYDKYKNTKSKYFHWIQQLDICGNLVYAS